MALLLFIVLAALGVSGLCSILEASLLSSSVIELSQRKAKNDAGAARLLHIKEHQIDDAISAILTYNTIAHTVGAALSGAQAAVVFGDAWVGVFSGVLTLLILVFTEIIPKTVGTVYAGRLAGFSGRVITLMIKPPMKWLLYLTRGLTRMIANEGKRSTTRGDVVAMVEIAAREGALASDESEFLSNLLRFREIRVREVMTPRTVMAMCQRDQSVGDALDLPEIRAFSRLPVFADTRDDIVGYVLTRQLLEASRDEGGSDRPLADFLRPVAILSEELPLATAMKELVRRREQVAVVIDELGVLSGLVTLEDIFETALGAEIVDEIDQVEDLRKKALELRDQRLKRFRDRWPTMPPGDDEG